MELELTTRSQFDMLEDVADFHETILGQDPALSPSLIDLPFCIERFRFMQEELDEFIEEAYQGNIVGVADALADIVYVALGTAYIMNLPFEDIWKAVQNANMRKERGVTKRGNKFDAIKPAGWVGPEPEIARAIERCIK
jgi:predicted HAD superfamily Cof-like phosphohydrolase